MAEKEAPSEEEHCNERRRSMSEPADFFEFTIPNTSSEYTFSWNDLIWPSAPCHQPLLLSPCSVVSPPRSTKTRRSESFNESKIATQYSSLLKSPCFRPSRSLDYCRLRRNPSSTRSIPTSSVVDSSGRVRAQPRSPPWYCLMFGPLKFPPPPEIEIRRSARNRRSSPPGALFPATEKGRGWKLISVLSCKSDASVAVTTPFQPYC